MSKIVMTTRIDVRERLTTFQKEIHTVNAQDEILSTWRHMNIPILRNAENTVTFKMSATSSDNTNTRSDETKQVEYVLDERFDLLVKTFLKQRIPDIHVKKEYVDTIQIAWPRYLGLI